MGDITRNVEEDENFGVDEEDSNVARESIDMLKETKELADITNSDAQSLDTTPTANENMESDVALPTAEQENNAAANIETVFDNAGGMEKTTASAAPVDNIPEPPQEISNMRSCESGRMNKLRDHASNIFPAGIMGCKEDIPPQSPRRFLDALEASKDNVGHIDATPRKMPSASKSDHGRNPLTGSGVAAIDEIKRTGSKKRVDGNPVLGVGYENKASSNSTTRIPPGGFSHGLW